MSNSTNLALPFLTQGQAQKHVTVNESLLRLDALVQISVVSATTAAQPASPSDGQSYILPAGKTGAAWGAMSNGAIAYYRDGIWEQINPREGWLGFVRDSDQLLFYTGAAWALFPSTKILNVSATDKVLGRISSGAGAAEEVTFTDQAQALCDDTSFTAMRATLSAAGLADANTFTNLNQISVAVSGNPAPGAAHLTLANSDGGAVGPCLVTFHDSASPAAADFATRWRVYGRDSAANQQLYGTLDCIIDDPSSGSEDARWSLKTTQGGALAEVAAFGLGVTVGAPSGGDKGAGTLNASAVYDDNALLTCFVIEYARTGALDLDFWDRLAPDGKHAAAHRFWEERHLLDLDAYIAHWRTHGHLPGLPSREAWAEHGRDKRALGDLVSRLWASLEMHAVQIARLRDQLKLERTLFESRLCALEKA